MTKSFDLRHLVGSNIHRIRSEKKITQERLAEKIGISNVSLSKIENGKSFPDCDNLEKIICALEIKPYELFVTFNEDVAEYGEMILKTLKKAVSPENLLNNTSYRVSHEKGRKK